LIEKLIIGDQVKLNFVTISDEGRHCSEEMWVVITKKRLNDFAGTLTEQPKKIKELELRKKYHLV
jgi:hypothetical protein